MPYTTENIAKAVSKLLSVPVYLMKHPTRSRETVLARQMAMCIAKTLNGDSLGNIGAYFQRINHTTVMHAIRTIQNLCDTDEDFRDYYRIVFEKVKNMSVSDIE